MQLFYDHSLTKDSKLHTVGAEESNHILRVLRKTIGDKIHLTNGKGDGFYTEIVGISSKRCEISILETFSEKPLPYSLHVAIAPPKSSDRFEFFLEKATEIGITEITPILCANSERKRINTKRSLKILQSAMKQSQRLFLPRLNDMMGIDQFLSLNHEENLKLIAHCEDDEKISLKEKLGTTTQFCGLIGPEGDFSREEIEQSINKGFQPVSLGEKRLRTETAGLYLCQSLAFHLSL
jgi:16S rRNA (uracil1498-N3)-methyltransferase